MLEINVVGLEDYNGVLSDVLEVFNNNEFIGTFKSKCFEGVTVAGVSVLLDLQHVIQYIVIEYQVVDIQDAVIVRLQDKQTIRQFNDVNQKDNFYHIMRYQVDMNSFVDFPVLVKEMSLEEYYR